MKKLIIGSGRKEIRDLTEDEIAFQEFKKQVSEEQEAADRARLLTVKQAYQRLKASPNEQIQDVLVILRFLYNSIEN